MPDNVRALHGIAPSPVERPKAPPGIPVPPTWLDQEGRAEWDRVAKGLDNMGILGTIDRAVLALYCETWSVWNRARRDLRAASSGRQGAGTEVLVDGDKGRTVKSPAWQVYRDAATTLRELARELGLTPATRLRMELPTRADDDPTADDPFD